MHISKQNKPAGEGYVLSPAIGVLEKTRLWSQERDQWLLRVGRGRRDKWGGGLRAILGSETTLSEAVTSILKHVFKPQNFQPRE